MPSVPPSTTATPGVDGPRLDGRVVVVTGGGSGIGRATVDRCRAAGAIVVAADLQPPPESPGVLALDCDVTSEADVAMVMRRAGELGPLAAIVTSAGITSKCPIEEMELTEWRRLLDVNLTGTMLAIKYAVPLMKIAGSGSIVTIASVAAFRTSSPFNSAYAASKGAIVGMVKALVHELAPQGIRVNAIAPGIVESPLTVAFGASWLASRSAVVPLGRLGTPEEMAEVALFLASDMSRYITGQVLVADGGSTSVVIAPPTA